MRSNGDLVNDNGAPIWADNICSFYDSIDTCIVLLHSDSDYQILLYNFIQSITITDTKKCCSCIPASHNRLTCMGLGLRTKLLLNLTQT